MQQGHFPLVGEKPRWMFQRGFNLIEAAIVLGVIGLVLGSIWLAASTVMEGNRIKNTVAGVLSASQNARKLLPSSMITGGWVGISSPTAINMRIFPEDWVKGSALITPWGTVNKVGMGVNGNNIQISVGVPDESSCLKITALITSRFKDRTDLAGIAIGPFGVGPWTSYSTWPLSPAGSHCSGITPPIELAFQFTFGLMY